MSFAQSWLGLAEGKLWGGVLVAVVAASLCGRVTGQIAGGKKTPSTSPATTSSHVDILNQIPSSDIAWLEKKYLPEVIKRTKKEWYRLVPDEARTPESKRGQVTVQFVIKPDGRITGERLDGSRGDLSMDQAAFNAIQQASPFSAFGKKRNLKELQLRFIFTYNETPKGGGN